jgi:hypothetical protein
MLVEVRPRIAIGAVVRNAIVFNPRYWGDSLVSTDTLLQAVERLFALLYVRRIDYVLVGGIALLQYVEGRNTEDIDLIISLPSLSRLPEISLESQDANFARGRFEGLQIDFLLTRNRLFDAVHKRFATSLRFVEREIPCATVEGLLLLKLYALPSLYRQGNFARVGLYESDIALLIQAYRPVMMPLFGELEKHLLESDLESVRQIVAEIEQRIARFDAGRRTRAGKHD